MKKRKWSIAACCLVLALVSGLWLAARSSRGRTWTLPDGSTLELVKVTQGTNHFCRYGNRLVDYLYPIVPEKYRSVFKFRVVRWPEARWSSRIVSLSHATIKSFPREDLVVWMRQRSSAFVVRVVDSFGIESDGLPYFSAAELYAAGAVSYPRMAPFVRFRIYGRKPGSVDYLLVGEFSIPNKVRRDLPVWQPEQLPATRNVGALSITLLGLTTGLTQLEIRDVARFWTHASYSIHQERAISNEWHVASISVESPVGERRVVTVSSLQSPGVQEAVIRGGLWLDEPTWKVTFDLSCEGTTNQICSVNFFVRPTLAPTNASPTN